MAPILPRYGFNVLPSTTIGAAGTVTGIEIPLRDVKHLQIIAKFVRDAGGTDVKVFIQTSLDGGVTFIDLMNVRFTTATATKVSAAHRDTPLAAAITPSDAGLANDVVVNGLIGDRIRAVVVSTGTYTGATTLIVEAVAHR